MPEYKKYISVKTIIMESRNFRNDPRVNLWSWRKNPCIQSSLQIISVVVISSKNEMDNITSIRIFSCSFYTIVSLLWSIRHHKQGYGFGDNLLPFSCVRTAILNSSSEKALSFLACRTCFSPLLNHGQSYWYSLPRGILVKAACFQFQDIFSHKTNAITPHRER